jgi:hypothetical protein
MIQPRKRNSSKINLTVSLIFHSVLILAVVFFAARENLLGNRLKQLAVTMVPKAKPPEPPKEKPPEPKPQPPKPDETPKVAETAPKPDTAPPPATVAATAAPVAAPAAIPSDVYIPGGKEVETISDPKGMYKALVEHTLRSRWNRPEDIADDNFVAEVELDMDNSTGAIKDYRWVKQSGNTRWDASVKAALDQTKVLNSRPPKDFPQKFNVRFDVESLKTEPVLSLSSVQ